MPVSAFNFEVVRGLAQEFSLARQSGTSYATHGYALHTAMIYQVRMIVQKVRLIFFVKGVGLFVAISSMTMNRLPLKLEKEC